MPTQYEAEGGIILGGCSGLYFKSNYDLKYEIGERVWIAQKARSGEAESVVIKRLSRNRNARRVSYEGVQWQIAYTDTFNRVWMEYELATESEAVEFMEAYREKKIVETRKFYEKSCFPIKPAGCV